MIVKIEVIILLKAKPNNSTSEVPNVGWRLFSRMREEKPKLIIEFNVSVCVDELHTMSEGADANKNIAQ